MPAAWGCQHLDSAAVNIPSEWQQDRMPTEGPEWATQTDTAEYAEIDAQTALSLFQNLETADQEIQTSERPDAVPEAVQDPVLDGFWTYPGAKDADDGKGQDKLGMFLSKIGKEVEELLLGNVQSFAFDGYDVAWTEEKTGVELLHTLVPPQQDVSQEEDLQVMDLAWNCNGVTIAAAYGRIDEVAWCQRQGMVCCWNTARKDLAKPDTVIETWSYICCVAFHPVEPALLVGGSYTGEIIMWNVSAGTTVASTVLAAPSGHREPVSKVMWLADRTTPRSHRNHYLVGSVAGDGRILFWTRPEKEPGELEGPVQGNLLRRPGGLAQARAKRRVSMDSDSDDDRFSAPTTANPWREALLTHTGILSFCVLQSVRSRGGGAQVPFADNPIVVGTEVGQVCRTKIDIARVKQPIKGGDKELTPLQLGSDAQLLEPHYGPVQACSASPFDRNLFLTASSDGTVRLRSALEKGSLLTLEPSGGGSHYIYCAEWSPFRPCVLAVGTRSSQVYIYDLEHSTLKPECLDAGEEHPVIALQFNPVGSTLATGDGRGSVKLWQLSNQLTQTTRGEQQLIGLPASEDSKRRDAWARLIGISL